MGIQLNPSTPVAGYDPQFDANQAARISTEVANTKVGRTSQFFTDNPNGRLQSQNGAAPCIGGDVDVIG